MWPMHDDHDQLKKNIENIEKIIRWPISHLRMTYLDIRRILLLKKKKSKRTGVINCRHRWIGDYQLRTLNECRRQQTQQQSRKILIANYELSRDCGSHAEIVWPLFLLYGMFANVCTHSTTNDQYCKMTPSKACQYVGHSAVVQRL